jgi:hypothetical protein
MNDRQSRLIHAAKSGVVFARDLKNPPLRVTDAATRVDAAVHAAFDAQVKQLNAKNSRGGPRISVKRAKTILLRKHLDPIAADGLEMFAGLPGIEESLHVPRLKDAPEKHLKAAERVRKVAEEHEQELIDDRNYSENFLEKFDAAVRDLEAAARVERGAARAKYSRATEDVKEAIARVRRVFDALDTRIREAYLDDGGTLQLWRKVSRVPAKMGRPRKRKSAAGGRALKRPRSAP